MVNYQAKRVFQNIRSFECPLSKLSSLKTTKLIRDGAAVGKKQEIETYKEKKT